MTFCITIAKLLSLTAVVVDKGTYAIYLRMSFSVLLCRPRARVRVKFTRVCKLILRGARRNATLVFRTGTAFLFVDLSPTLRERFNLCQGEELSLINIGNKSIKIATSIRRPNLTYVFFFLIEENLELFVISS